MGRGYSSTSKGSSAETEHVPAIRREAERFVDGRFAMPDAVGGSVRELLVAHYIDEALTLEKRRQMVSGFPDKSVMDGINQRQRAVRRRKGELLIEVHDAGVVSISGGRGAIDDAYHEAVTAIIDYFDKKRR